MLSCTVENRAKDLLKINPQWTAAIEVADGQQLLQAILKYLDDQKAMGLLNNNGIPRMVRGYFYEMACVIAECARVLKPNAPLFMVNDNVRYADILWTDRSAENGFLNSSTGLSKVQLSRMICDICGQEGARVRRVTRGYGKGENLLVRAWSSTRNGQSNAWSLTWPFSFCSSKP